MTNGGGDVIVYDFDGTLVEGDIGAAFIRHLLQGWRRALLLPFAPLGFALMRFEATRRAGVSIFLFFGALGRRIDLRSHGRALRRNAAHAPARTRTRVGARGRPRRASGGRGDGRVRAAGAGRAAATGRVSRRHPGRLATAAALGQRRGGTPLHREAKLRALAGGLSAPYVRAVSDAAIDLPLLLAAREAVLVNASDRCRSKVRQAIGSRLVDADLPALPLS